MERSQYKNRIALAIQKPGEKARLGTDTFALLKSGGMSFEIRERKDDAPSNIPGFDLLMTKNGDTACMVQRGEANLAIVGQDKYVELDDPTVAIVRYLGFSAGKLILALPDELLPYNGPQSIAGFRVGTAYPKSTERWAQGNKTNLQIVKYEGGAETWARRGFVDGCVEFTESGASLQVNVLSSVDVVLRSEAVLIANTDSLVDKKGSERIVWQVLRRLMAGLWQTQYRMMAVNYPVSLRESVFKVLPSSTSPTETPLGLSGWEAAQSVVPIARSEEVTNQLLRLGARDIIETAIQKMVPNIDDPVVNEMMRAIYTQAWNPPSPKEAFAPIE